MPATFGDFIKAFESSALGEPTWTFDDDQHLPVVARWMTTDGPVAMQTHPDSLCAYFWHKEQCAILDTPAEVKEQLDMLTLAPIEPLPPTALGDEDTDVPF